MDHRSERVALTFCLVQEHRKASEVTGAYDWTTQLTLQGDDLVQRRPKVLDSDGNIILVDVVLERQSEI